MSRKREIHNTRKVSLIGGLFYFESTLSATVPPSTPKVINSIVMDTEAGLEYTKTQERIEEIKKFLSSSNALTQSQKTLANLEVAALEQISQDIDAGHRRIRGRKKEIACLSEALRELTDSQLSLIDSVEKLNKKQEAALQSINKSMQKLLDSNTRFRRMVVAILILSISFMTVLLFGGGKLFSVLNYLTTAIKVITTIA